MRLLITENTEDKLVKFQREKVGNLNILPTMFILQVESVFQIGSTFYQS